MPPKPLILFAASEMYPFSKTGGLGDVMGALPLTLHRKGLNTAIVTPLYGRLNTSEYPLHLIYSDCPVGYPWPPITCDVYMADFHGMPVYFIHKDEYFDRRFYYNTYKGDYFDNCERFIFFSRAVLELAQLLETPPAVLHANDWQTALIPAFANFLRASNPAWRETHTIFTIHNLAFQGRFSSRLFFNSGLPPHAWSVDGVEYFGDFNLLKGGIAYADVVTTVSPSYAEEIRISPDTGCGLEGILTKRADRVRGILNGADYDVWDPRNDRYLPCCYSAEDVAGKASCKAHLLEEYGMDEALHERPVLGFIGRLREQKGIDLLIEIIPEIMKLDVGLVILGEGDHLFEEQILGYMEDYIGRLSAIVGYTEDLAHRIQAGCDIFLMPSRYEPCGLTQMYALRYGAPPVATAAGGLRDTIVSHPHPEATGFTFATAEAAPFLQATKDAVALWEDTNAWTAMRDRAMRQEFTWEKAATRYLDLYRELGAVL